MMTAFKSKWEVQFENYKDDNVEGPLGYTRDKDALETSSSSGTMVDNATKVQSVAWSIAVEQGSQLPMNLFMMWMSGNHVNMYSMMMTGVMCWNPIKSLMSMNDKFKQRLGNLEEDQDFTLQKLAYLGINIVGVCLALYKLKNLGLLPTTESDWLEFMQQSQPLEASSGGFVQSS
eukprot:m.292726 g.292726  ORF g.292726 m.292726 type:complete len:175 (+) comp20008_c0_seq3:172-696(+)